MATQHGQLADRWTKRPGVQHQHVRPLLPGSTATVRSSPAGTPSVADLLAARIGTRHTSCRNDAGRRRFSAGTGFGRPVSAISTKCSPRSTTGTGHGRLVGAAVSCIGSAGQGFARGATRMPFSRSVPQPPHRRRTEVVKLCRRDTQGQCDHRERDAIAVVLLRVSCSNAGNGASQS